MELRGKDKWIVFILVLSLLFGMLAVLGLFAGAFMHMLGLQYDSIGSLILFFVVASVIGFILNLAVNIMIGLIYAMVVTSVGIEARMSRASQTAALVLLDTLSSIAAFKMVDACMESVSAGTVSVVTISILFAFLTAFGHEKEKQEEQEEIT